VNSTTQNNQIKYNLVKIPKNIFTLALLVSSVISLSSANAVGKAPAPDLFDYAGVPQTANKTLPPKAVKGRNHSVTVNTDLLDLDTLTLNLFDDVVVTAILDRLVDNQGSKTWIGHVEGEQGSEVFLTVRGKTLSGNVQIGDKTYEIEYKGNNKHDITQVDPDKNPEHSHSKTIDDFIAAGGELGTVTTTAEATINTTTAAGTVIDLMVLYTPQAKLNASGQTGIEAKIANAVEMANQAYINSQINMQLNVVHVAEVNYTETGKIQDALSKMAVTNDGVIDEIHSWRDQYGADQVLMVTADANACGIAYVMSSPSSSFKTAAFSTVHDDSKYACLSDNTLAHELGHNQGSQHNREDANTAGAYDYSYGYRLCQTGGFRTVMSYSCSGGTRVSYFSNPDVQLSAGEVTGTVTENNALSTNNTKAVVAAFRTAVDSTAPNAPSNLTATAISDTAITVIWNDNSGNETGFRVERSVDGINWTEIAVTGSNSTSFNDTGLFASTNYSYRVRAYNSNGFSQYSNTGSVLTTAANCATATPALSLAPSSLYTQTNAATSFNISLTNKDSSACGISAFTLTNSDGATLGTFTLSPAGSTSTVWSLTAPSVDGTYNKSVTVSATGHSNASAVAMIIVDGTAPTAPGNLSTAVSRKTQVKLSWSASTDAGSGIDHYEVFRNGIKLSILSGTSYTDKVSGKGTYDYMVKAFDKAGNSIGSQRSITL